MIDEKSEDLKKKIRALSIEEYEDLLERIGDMLWTEFSNFTDDYIEGYLSGVRFDEIVAKMTRDNDK